MGRFGAVGATLADRARRLGPSPEQIPPMFTIELDYEVFPSPRYGWGLPAHPQVAAIIAADRDLYRQKLTTFTGMVGDLRRIPTEWTSDTDPYWNNHWFQGLDIVALYCFLAQWNPATCLEIGSGYSTRVARRSIRDHHLRTRLVSIDPEPRSTVSSITDEHIAKALEDVDLSVFDQLRAGDVLLFDGSHRVFTNSDVTVFFTEVLSRLSPGVLVEVHDIFLPWDYRPEWSDRWYSEQYLLASWLLGGSRLRVLMPNFYVSVEADLNELLTPIWEDVELTAVNHDCPSGFWFEVSD